MASPSPVVEKDACEVSDAAELGGGGHSLGVATRLWGTLVLRADPGDEWSGNGLPYFGTSDHQHGSSVRSDDASSSVSSGHTPHLDPNSSAGRDAPDRVVR